MLRKSILIVTIVQFLFAAMALSQSQYNGSIGGRVTTLNGGSVHGALIKATGANPADSSFFQATTDGNGNYRLRHLPPSDYTLVCMYGGVAIPYSGTVTVGDSSEVTGINFQLPAPHIVNNLISGVVTKGGTGEPLSWVSVTLSNVAKLYRANTNDSGKYHFSRIAPGTYAVWGYLWNYEVYQGADSVVINDSSVITDLNFSLTAIVPNGVLSGIVTNSTTSAPVVGATVDIGGNSTGNPPGHAVTDSTGAYTISNIWTGTYNVNCNAAGYEHKVVQGVAINGAVTLDISLTPIVAGAISGTVTKDGTGEAVGNAMIEFISADSGVADWRHRWTQTDSGGNYSANLPVGNYYVEVSIRGNCGGGHNGGPSATPPYSEYYDNAHTLSEATVVAVTDGQTTGNINFGIPTPVASNITVSGTVLDNQNNPLAGARVQLWSYSHVLRGEGSVATTDSSGNYNITVTTYSTENIKFIVSARKHGYEIEFYNEKATWSQADVFTTLGDTTLSGVNFTLDPNGTVYTNSISGNVTDNQGAALAGTMVLGFGTTRHRPAMATTDSLGNYTLDQLRPDDYLILFVKDGYVSEFYDNAYTWETGTRVTATGSITGINDVLDTTMTDSSNGKISGVIKDANNVVAAGVFISFKNASGQVVASTVTDNMGKYSVSGLGVSTYTISSTKLGYTSDTKTATIDASQPNVVLNAKLNPSSVLSVHTTPTANIPTSVTLKDNYPNPFNPSTVIGFGIPEAQIVHLTVYNVLGQRVAELINSFLPAGNYSVTWNASDNSGNKVSSGMYFYALETGTANVVKKMILSK